MTQTPIAQSAAARTIWRLTGADVLKFLQGLVTNDVLPLAKAPGLIWAALLSPQGKYLSDFFVVHQEGEAGILIDIDSRLAEATLRRLTMYKLRSDVQIAQSDLVMSRGTDDAPLGAQTDPRHPALGWRYYSTTDVSQSADWDALRLAHIIPEFPNELRIDDSYILEANFERLHGVDFRKGCYVGQEVTARMKHKTDLRKGLIRLRIEGHAAPGTPITLPDGREAGILGSSYGGAALAHMRYDRLSGPLTAGEAHVFAEDQP